MNRRVLTFLCFVAVACSISVAQEAKAPPTQEEVAVAPLEEAPVEEEAPKLPEPRRADRTGKTSRLEAEWLTKICASEGDFRFTECQKLLQTLENMRERRQDKSLLSAMYAQCARVTRRKPFTDPRQIWVSHLPMEGSGRPAKGWVECTGRDPETRKSTPTGCTGTWAAVLKQWLPFRTQVAEMFYSGLVPEIIPGRPIQWGGDMDYWRGAGRNFCPLNHGDRFHNTFWGDPKDNTETCLPVEEAKIKRSKSISAFLASGKAQRKLRIQQLLIQQPRKEGSDNDTTRIASTPGPLPSSQD